MLIVTRILTILFFSFTVVATYSFGEYAQFPVIEQGDIQPNDRDLGNAIDRSKTGELTIVSFNVRNLGATERTLQDLEAIVDLVDEADIVVFQEAGLGLFGSGPLMGFRKKRWESILSVFQTYFGLNWKVITAEEPSGNGQGRETTIVAHRIEAAGFRILVEWIKYVDLGPRRDMALFEVRLQGSNGSSAFQLGSVHLKPDDPYRGQEMIKVADWLVEQSNNAAIVMGDFNWGYKRAKDVVNYKGENYITALHNEGKIFQLFKALSYLGSGNSQQLRTNLGFRKSRQMYDQFLLSPSLANKMADGGKLLKDTGFLAFGVHNKRMQELIHDDVMKMNVGLDSFKVAASLNTTSYSDAELCPKVVRGELEKKAAYLV